MFENPRRGKQARNFTRNVPKILDLKSSSEQIFSESIRWVPLIDDELIIYNLITASQQSSQPGASEHNFGATGHTRMFGGKLAD